MTAKEFYLQQVHTYKNQKQLAQKKVVLLATLRLAVFIIAALSVYILGQYNFVYALLLLEIALFLYLVHLSSDANYAKKRAQKMIEINERELQTLSGNWSAYRDGTIYRSSQHPFSQDMDLFGPRSLFQLVNRTVTKGSERMLAERLQFGTKDPSFVNHAIEEFSKHPDWCQQYLAEALVYLDEDKDENLQKIKNISVENSAIRKVLIYLLPVIAIGSTALFVVDMLNGAILTGIIALILSVVGSQLKNTNRISIGVNRYETVVSVDLHRIALLEKLKFQNPMMQAWKEEQIGSNGELLELFTKLAKLQKQMSYRMNIFVGVLLNFFLAWDFRVVQDWENWLEKYGDKIDSMEDRLAEIEVWISGAIYMNNFRHLTYATFTEEDVLKIDELGHPFISDEIQVYNDLNYQEEERIQIITGPNMAGKSTYLRSVGWAIISANAGFPVMARHCVIPHLKLYTSMRNSDDLSGSSSFFHAELSRLRFIVDAIENGEKVFVILDEILKGTNSIDKEKGSIGFLKKLSRLNARGIIATHDLSLCQLSDQQRAFRNRYFDSTIQQEELMFDYQIRDGVCQNMNASFLLKKMGLVE